MLLRAREDDAGGPSDRLDWPQEAREEVPRGLPDPATQQGRQAVTEISGIPMGPGVTVMRRGGICSRQGNEPTSAARRLRSAAAILRRTP